MTTLSPSGYSRHRSNALPIVLAVVFSLAVGVAGGWWFAGRGHGKTTASPSATSTCHSSGSTSASATGTTSSSPPPGATSTKKPTVKPTTVPGALPRPSTITVNVYNATTRAGLARTTSVELAARGFRTGNVANDPAKKIIAASAEIRYGPAGALAAKVVAAQVIGAVLVPDHRKDATVDFVLGEGYAALATPQQAAAALAAVPTPSVRPTEC